MLVVMVVVVAIIGLGYLFIHALRAGNENRHGWLVVLPLVVMFGWLVEELLSH